MSSASSLLKDARARAGLTQAQLASRMGVSQAAVAKLEGDRANPRIATLDAVLRAAGRELVLSAKPLSRGIDETLVIEQLKLTPEQRLAQLERMYEWGQELARAGARFRGESV